MRTERGLICRFVISEERKEENEYEERGEIKKRRMKKKKILRTGK